MLEWEWFADPNTFRLFIYLLLSANHKKAKWQGADIMPGQLITGREALSKATGLTSQKIRTCLKKLENTQEITIKTTNKYSIISITKWKDYQNINQQLTNEQPTTNQPANHKQQVNNNNNETKERAPSKKGTRLPPDWKPNEDNLSYAKEKGLSESVIKNTAENFKDWWLSTTKNAVKLDWDATWRSWVRRDMDEPAAKANQSGFEFKG